MKNIFSLLMALTILAGANAGEQLTLSRKPFLQKPLLPWLQTRLRLNLPAQPLILYAIRYISMI